MGQKGEEIRTALVELKVCCEFACPGKLQLYAGFFFFWVRKFNKVVEVAEA